MKAEGTEFRGALESCKVERMEDVGWQRSGVFFSPRRFVIQHGLCTIVAMQQQESHSKRNRSLDLNHRFSRNVTFSSAMQAVIQCLCTAQVACGGQAPSMHAHSK